MDERKRRQRREMRRAVARGVLIVAVFALASPFAVSAQATTTPERATRPLILGGVEQSRPLDGAATIAILFPLRPLERSGDLGGQMRAYRGLLVEAAAGAEGFQLAAGWGRRLKEPKSVALFGEDIMATAFRRKDPSGAVNADTTYVGGELGLTMLTFRMSVGAATRVAGPNDSDRTIFTWGVGFNIGR